MSNFFVLSIFIFCKLSVSLQLPTNSNDTPGRTALDNFPLTDGHNDVPNNLHSLLDNKIANFSFEKDLSQDPIFGTSVCRSCFTDLARLTQGKMGAQFWAAYVDCNAEDKNFVSKTLTQIDVIKRLVNKYPNNMELVTTADGMVSAFKNKKLASLIGVEGGHSIDNKLSVLRLLYELGVRYLTLTHSCNLDWADASPVDSNGISGVVNLTEFGQRVVLEMNRVGMMVDLSHVSHNTMSEAIDVSKAPIIFSHSSAFAIYPHHRNVRDNILLKVKSNGGIVMVNFYSAFVGRGNVTLEDVINHINHIVDIAGIDHVGLGADYDGVNSVPKGLEDVSKYPDLFDRLKELNPERWTIENLEKLAGRNLYIVFKKVEEVRDQLSNLLPDESLIDSIDAAVLKSESTNIIA